MKKISKDKKLLDELVAILSNHCGEHGDNEGAIETLNRIINERNQLEKNMLGILTQSRKYQL